MNIIYQQCPVCGSNEISKIFTAKDYTVSGELFDVFHCSKCTLRFTQNVPDQQDIGPYYKAESYISHTDTQKGLVSKAYHMVRKHTLKAKRKLLVQKIKSLQGNLLDIGAGTGAFLNEMKNAGWQVTGLEPDADARSVAERLYGLKLQLPDELYHLPEASYNAITLWHVLEHVHDLHGYVKIFSNILKPDGKLFIAVPNYTSADAAKYGAHWAAYDVPRHLYHFSPESMHMLMRAHGMEVVQQLPMWFDSFYVSMLSEKYKNGNSAMLSAIASGLSSNLSAGKDYSHCSSVIYVIEKR